MMKSILGAFALCVFCVMPGVTLACSTSPILTGDLNRSSVIAAGVFHIMSSEKRELPGPVGGYEIEGIVELREPHVLRNRGRRRDPIQFRFLFHYATDCAYGYLPMEGERAKVWLRDPRKKGGLLDLFYYETLKR
jgi:hypothetical protein